MARHRWLAALLLAFTLVAAGCGGDDGGSGEGTDEASTTEVEDADEGQVLIEDDFDDDDNLWRVDELDLEDEQDLSIEDGAFTTDWLVDATEVIEEGEVIVPNQLWPSVLDGVADELADVRIEAEVSFESPGIAGLACRIADVAPGSTDYRAYFFQVSPAGQVNLIESDEEGALNGLELVPDLEEDELEDVEELPLEDAAFEFDDGGPHELAMTCVDGEDGVDLTGFVDGEEVISVTDDEDPIDAGQAGVLSGQSGFATEIEGFEPFEVSYDSVTIVNLGDEIDEDDIEQSAEEAEEAADEPIDEPADTTLPPSEPTDELASDLLGVPLDPTSIADFGTDQTFDLLATNCYLGTFTDCDTLYLETPAGGSYETYGSTCGGRLETGIEADCANAADYAATPSLIPASGIGEFGTDSQFDQLALDCEAGDLEACDELYRLTPVGSGYEAYGSTCGARGTEEYDGGCIG